MTDYYFRHQSATSLFDDSRDFVTELLWGDPIRLETPWNTDPTWAKVKARSSVGWVRKGHLKKRSGDFNGLLEFYIIDVGQGDGVLCRTPDDKWHLIDAGVPNYRQMTKEGAANFLRWKFYRDLGLGGIELHSLTATHPDFDH